jgi:hypothetical protein
MQGDRFIKAWSNIQNLKLEFYIDMDWLAEAFSSTLQSFVSGVVRARFLHRKQPQPLFDIMCTNLLLEERLQPPECLYQRDRAFSLLGLANDKSNDSQFPDYTKPTEAMYEELTRASVRHGFLHVLSLSQFARNISANAIMGPGLVYANPMAHREQ